MKKNIKNIPKKPLSDSFKGIWIPKSVCLNTNLTNTEQKLMGVIYALSQTSEARKYGGCFATNSYLATIMSTSKGSIAKMLSDLRNKKQIKTIDSQHSMNDKIRVLKIVSCVKDFKKGFNID